MPERQADRSFDSKSTSQGFARTLFVTTYGVFVLGANGLLGPLPAPASGPIAGAGLVGNDDGIVVVSTDGSVWFARSGESAMKADGYESRGKTAPPIAIDTAANVVAVVASDALHVSLDAGKSFRRLALPGRERPTDVLARADGVVVVRTGSDAKSTLHVSIKAGPLARSTYQPNSVYKRGGVIASPSGCDAALATDGRTWFAPGWKTSKPHPKPSPRSDDFASAIAPVESARRDDPLGVQGYDELYLRLDTALVIRPPDKLTTPLAPPAPPRPAPALVARGEERVCDGDTMAMLGLLGTGEECTGAGCLVNAWNERVPRTRKETLVFNDGRCAAGDVVQKPYADTTLEECRTGALPARAPTLARIDHDGKTLRTVDVPRDCRVVEFVKAGSAAWIGCADKNETRVFALGEDDRFVAEQGGWPRELVVRSVNAGPDGTLVVSGEGRKTIVRAPPTGTTPARWFALPPDAAAPVVLGEGRVLVARVASPTSPEATIGIASPAGFTPLAPAIRPSTAATRIFVTAAGQVELELDPSAGHPVLALDPKTSPKSRVVLMNDGTLEPVRRAAR